MTSRNDNGPLAITIAGYPFDRVQGLGSRVITFDMMVPLARDPKDFLMALQKIADGTVKRLVRSVPGLEFTETQLDEVRTLIESALEDTMAEAAAAYREVTVMCCGAEADLAHKINHEAERKTDLLVSQMLHLR